MMKYILICALLSFTVFADEGRVDPIKKGESAQYDGFTVDKPQMKKFITINEERKLLDEKCKKLDELNKLQEAEMGYCAQQKKDLETQLVAEKRAKWIVGGALFLGGLMTGGVVFAVLLPLL
jgi:hypothetical protein